MVLAGQSWLDLWGGEWVSEWPLVGEVVRSRWFESKKRIWSYSEHNLNRVPPRIGQLEAKRIYPATAHIFVRLTSHHRGKLQMSWATFIWNMSLFCKKWFDIVNVIFKVTHSTKGFHTWICHMGWGGDLGSYEDCLTSSIFSSDESLLPLNCAMGTKCFLVLKEPFGTIESHPQAMRNWVDKIVSDYMPSRQI